MNVRVRVLDGLWVFLLGLYILAGTPVVPFHGDESTTLWMSRDFAYLRDDLNRVRFHRPPLNATEQELRLITTSLTKYAMGISWSLNGYTAEDINEQWDWGAGWDYNQQFGHAPDDRLLMLGRWPSALMLAVGVGVLFGIGLQVAGRPAAYAATLYYALNPALLLNGRRAMFEGGFILFLLLIVFCALWFVRRRDWLSALLLGLVTGLAVSAKHPAVFTAAAVFAGSAGLFLWQMRRERQTMQALVKWVAAGVLSLLVFYAMNPIWWDDPLARVGQSLEARANMLEGQVNAFGDYTGFGDQIVGFGRQVLVVLPQYYEVDGWETFIGDQIARYEDTLWRGVSIGGSLPGAFIVSVLAVLGFWQLLRTGPLPVRWVLLPWVIVVVGVALLTPLEWQRYYLMAHLVMAVLLGLGIQNIASWLAQRQQRVH
ncbi:MAG: hypothetical protein OHK0046_26680 [Anaerolineae bacterium]